jgi:F-box protein 9
MAQPDTVELAQFRERWKAEVQSRKKPSAVATVQQGPSEPPRLHSATLPATQKTPSSSDSKRVHVNTAAPSQNLLSALQIYRDAVQREQNGELDDALLLYRQAFRMVFLITYSTFLVNLKIRC